MHGKHVDLRAGAGPVLLGGARLGGERIRHENLILFHSETKGVAGRKRPRKSISSRLIHSRRPSATPAEMIKFIKSTLRRSDAGNPCAGRWTNLQRQRPRRERRMLRGGRF